MKSHLSDEILRAAVIGCGRIGWSFDADTGPSVYSHAGAYAHSPCFDLIAVADTRIEFAQACSERFQVEAAYSDYAELLERHALDVVSICTPDETHATIALHVIERTNMRGILIEKPLATDVEAAQRLVRLAAERGVTVCVNYSRRFANG